MALIRARVLVGSAAARAQLAGVIDTILTMPRDPAKLRADVLEMRAEMARHKPARGPLDAKLARGGLVDLEFITHYLQLRDGVGMTPDLQTAIADLAGAGLLPQTVGGAYDLMTRMLVGTRLLAPDLAPPGDAAAAILARLCLKGDGTEDFATLLARFAAARGDVAAAWRAVFGEELEIEE